MAKLTLLSLNQKNKLIQKRAGETKIGKHIQLISSTQDIYEQLCNLDVDYVIFGISEDVGVFANYGKQGASKTWSVTLKRLLNIQSNHFLKGNRVCILGHLDFSDELKIVASLNPKKKKDILKARILVTKIDTWVSKLTYDIVKARKIPIAIGGGHNNSYGILKGTALAKNTSINAINFDAHSDFRAKEGRHSGNGFTYAKAEGFLDRYYIFGLHENYTSTKVLDILNKTKTISYTTFESIEIRKALKYKPEMQKALKFVSNTSFGIEIDCDAIENIPSSAITPSGFSANRGRQFIHYFAKHHNAQYLHICEAAPTKKTEHTIGKLLSYFITDFIKANAMLNKATKYNTPK